MARTLNDRRFDGRVALVTGGTSGIGEAVVRSLAMEGARVVFCGLHDDDGERVAREICDKGNDAQYVRADVRDDGAMAQLVTDIERRYGGLSLAVNNAGISHPPQRLADIDPARWRDVMATNADGVFYAMRHEIPAIIAYEGDSGKGAVVNVASILGTKGAPWIAAYGASKHAVLGLTLSAARDYATMGLRINAVSPGPVQTPMLERALLEIGGDNTKYAGGFPPAGPGSPKDVAAAVLFLLSEEASYINGANLLVDGATAAI